RPVGNGRDEDRAGEADAADQDPAKQSPGVQNDTQRRVGRSGGKSHACGGIEAGRCRLHRGQRGQNVEICYSEGRSRSPTVTIAMHDPNALTITPEISIPRSELTYR